MKVLIAGSSGLIGSAIRQALLEAGDDPYRLLRSKPLESKTDINWDPAKGILNPSDIEGFDVVIDLTGESIIGRWTPEKKRRILDSRVSSTRLLIDTFSKLESPPKVLIVASAIGYYGDRGDEPLTENSPAGEGFLSEVCKRREQTAENVKTTGTRLVILRIGVVLSRDGGALQKMLPVFRCGLGGKIGSGTQYMSWIAIDDLIGAVLHIIRHEACNGVFNMTSPEPVINDEFTKTLGSVLHRPTFMAVPAFPIRLLLGEAGQELFLSSLRVEPQKLLDAGYKFQYPSLKDALRKYTTKL